MAEKLPPWCKKAKIAMIQKDIGVSDMAERLGNNRSYISSVLNGRVVSPPIRKLQDVKAMMDGSYPFEKGRTREKDLDFDTFMYRP